MNADTEMLVMAVGIADAAVVTDIETNAIRAGKQANGQRMYDVRRMLDPKEHPPEVIDMARKAIDYAFARGLIERTEIDGVVAARIA